MGFTTLACFVATLSLFFLNENFDKASQHVHAAENIQRPFFAEFPDEHKSRMGRDNSQKEPTNLKIAAFNVKIFGKKKMATPGIPELLVEIVLRYDVILIQEIRDASGKAILKLLSLVNKNSTKGIYDITISPRLGRSSSKEQYAFLFRKDVLSVKHNYTYDDGREDLQSDTFEREPYIVHFYSSVTDITDFVLVAIHTSPPKANEEIDELVVVYDDVIRKLNMTDVIILGDLNAACSFMSDSKWKTNRLANDVRFHWLISDCVDTTVAGEQCAYDRFVVAGDAMLNAVIASSAESYKYDQELDINETMAVLVSDHYPIEMQIVTKELATALNSISRSVEHSFKMKLPPSLNKRKIFGKRKTLEAAEFTVERTYTKTRATSRMIFRKDFVNIKEALGVVQILKEKTTDSIITVAQTQNTEFFLTGPWIQEEQLLYNKTGTVKLVCEMYPQPSCWISLLFN